ncbi:hypothetical protein MC885_014000 [Smutsia gigantea]|nr:hypothetical protein MC885_014000 [Smutsia gigantea]
MAASSDTASDLESSGSDAEELARCREAAMPAWGLEQRPRGLEKPRAGFRLFFTSIPGGPKEKVPPQPHGKRLPSSSSSEDSDEEWQRCREAAVSASDILQESAIHGPVTVEKQAKRKKRKLIKKAKKEISADVATATTTTSRTTVGKQEKGSPELSGDQASLGTKKKKRKKKTKVSEVSLSPPAKSAAACLQTDPRSSAQLCFSMRLSILPMSSLFLHGSPLPSASRSAPGSTLTSAPRSSAVDRASPHHHPAKGAAHQEAPRSQPCMGVHNWGGFQRRLLVRREGLRLCGKGEQLPPRGYISLRRPGQGLEAPASEQGTPCALEGPGPLPNSQAKGHSPWDSGLRKGSSGAKGVPLWASWELGTDKGSLLQQALHHGFLVGCLFRAEVLELFEDGRREVFPIVVGLVLRAPRLPKPIGQLGQLSSTAATGLPLVQGAIPSQQVDMVGGAGSELGESLQGPPSATSPHYCPEPPKYSFL